MARLREEIDFHVITMLVMIAPGLCFSGWWLAVLLLIPQGRIFVRAFGENPSSGLRPWPYLVANELVVLGSAAMAGLLRLAVRRYTSYGI